MDFRHHIAAPSDLAGIEVDALVLVAGDGMDETLAAPLAALIERAVAEGDLVLKKGKTLFLHRPEGVTAGRVVVTVAAKIGAGRRRGVPSRLQHG